MSAFNEILPTITKVWRLIIIEAFLNVLRIMEIKSKIANPLPLEQREQISGLPTTEISDYN